MESERYKKSRWRRTFDAIDEAPFAARQFLDAHARVREAAWVGVAIVVLLFGVSSLVLPLPDGTARPPFAKMIGLGALIALVIKLAPRSPLGVRFHEWVVGPGLWVYFTYEIAAVVTTFGAERRALTYGIFLLFAMAHYAVFRGTFWPTLFSGVASSMTFLLTAWVHRFYSEPGFLQVGMYFVAMQLFGIATCFYGERHERLLYLTSRELEYEKSKAETLLLNILPKAIARRIRIGDEAVADSHAAASVIFIDLVGFTRLAESMPPARLVDILRELFLAYDALAEKHGIEKIKTIGDAYMAAAGVPIPCDDHAARCAAFALDVRAATADYRQRSGLPLYTRIGIHSGPLIAGVIGGKKMIYDVWGTTVNVASRMESHGQVDEIQITADTKELLGTAYAFSPGHTVNVKGLGEMRAFLLEPRAATASAPRAAA